MSSFKCDQCGRTYKQKANLASHLLGECGVEPSVPCPQCDKRFKRKDFLKRHLIEVHHVEHSQLATFGLGIAQHFTTSKNVYIKNSFSKNIGPVVRPENQFKCGQCGKSYKQKRSLKLHMAEKCGKQPSLV